MLSDDAVFMAALAFGRYMAEEIQELKPSNADGQLKMQDVCTRVGLVYLGKARREILKHAGVAVDGEGNALIENQRREQSESSEAS